MSEQDIEYLVYQRMCKYCKNARQCHDECETCEEYDKEVKELCANN